MTQPLTYVLEWLTYNVQITNKFVFAILIGNRSMLPPVMVSPLWRIEFHMPSTSTAQA